MENVKTEGTFEGRMLTRHIRSYAKTDSDDKFG